MAVMKGGAFMTKPATTTLATVIASAFILTAAACQLEKDEDLHLLSNGPGLPEQCFGCWEEFEACFEAGEDPAECEARIIECVIDCNAPPPPPTCEHCVAGYEACVVAAERGDADPRDCAAGLESCLYYCEEAPEPTPPDDCRECGDD
jgi:hypothetical protein